MADLSKHSGDSGSNDAKPITAKEIEESISLLRRMVMNQKRMILYTDTIQGNWTYRDDLWAISTSEVDAFISLIRRAQVSDLAKTDR